MRKRRITRIYDRITKISQKGNISYLEYSDYIDDIIKNGEYILLQDVFNRYYKTDIVKWRSIEEIKKKTWNVALFHTPSIFTSRLESYYAANNVYQIGQYIYDSESNDVLGRFIETKKINKLNFIGVSYSYQEPIEFYRNKDLYANPVTGMTSSMLEVIIGTYTNARLYLVDDNMTLIDKYKAGVYILRYEQESLNQYVVDNYIDNYFI